jgi:hypothetical protein
LRLAKVDAAVRGGEVQRAPAPSVPSSVRGIPQAAAPDPPAGSGKSVEMAPTTVAA